MTEKLKFELKVGFDIAKGGEKEDAEYLSITAPSNKVIQHVSILDEEMFKAVMTFTNHNKSDSKNNEGQAAKEETFDGSEIVMMLGAGKADLGKCFKALSQILCVTCTVNDTTPFTSYMFVKMSYIETKRLLGEYIKFFLNSSQII